MSTNLNNNTSAQHNEPTNNNTTNQQTTQQDHTTQQTFFPKTDHPLTISAVSKRTSTGAFVGVGLQHTFDYSYFQKDFLII